MVLVQHTDRIMPGGDLFERESAWFRLTDSRSESYVWQWLQTVDCPVIRLDGTRGVEENIRVAASAASGLRSGDMTDEGLRYKTKKHLRDLQVF